MGYTCLWGRECDAQRSTGPWVGVQNCRGRAPEGATGWLGYCATHKDQQGRGLVCDAQRGPWVGVRTVAGGRQRAPLGGWGTVSECSDRPGRVSERACVCLSEFTDPSY